MVKLATHTLAFMLGGGAPDVSVRAARRCFMADKFCAGLIDYGTGLILARRHDLLEEAFRLSAERSTTPASGLRAELLALGKWDIGDTRGAVECMEEAARAGYARGAGQTLAVIAHLARRLAPDAVPGDLVFRAYRRRRSPLNMACYSSVLQHYLLGELPVGALAAPSRSECERINRQDTWHEYEVLAAVDGAADPLAALRGLPWADWLLPSRATGLGENPEDTMTAAAIQFGFVAMRRGRPLAEGTVWPVGMVPPEVAAAVQARTKKRAAVRGVKLAKKKAGPRSVARKTAKKVAVKRKASRRRAKKEKR